MADVVVLKGVSFRPCE